MATGCDNPTSTLPCTKHTRQCLSHHQDQNRRRASALLHRRLWAAPWAASQSRRVRFGEPALRDDMLTNTAADGCLICSCVCLAHQSPSSCLERWNREANVHEGSRCRRLVFDNDETVHQRRFSGLESVSAYHADVLLMQIEIPVFCSATR